MGTHSHVTVRLLELNLISGLEGPSKAQEQEVALNFSPFSPAVPTMLNVSVCPVSPLASPSPDAVTLAILRGGGFAVWLIRGDTDPERFDANSMIRKSIGVCENNSVRNRFEIETNRFEIDVFCCTYK